jgi:hypothetical protein
MYVMMESNACCFADHYGQCCCRAPECLVIVGEEVGIAGVWLTGVEYRGLESMQHKVIGIEPEGVEYREPKSTRHKVIGLKPEGVEYRRLKST